MPKVVGLDWATEPRNRGLVEIQIADDFSASRIVRVAERVDDAMVVAACSDPQCEVVAVDTPFGWPAAFASFVSKWSPASAQASPPTPDEFRLRVTDRVVRSEARKQPLPVSADRIAMSARAWASLVARHALAPRIDTLGRLSSAQPTVIEVYPGASARVLDAASDREPAAAEPSYKKSATIRRRLVTRTAARFAVDCGPHVEEIVRSGEHSDETDAFLAALTAAIYLGAIKGATLAGAGWGIRRPAGGAETESALREGWIFFPLPRV